MTSQTPPPQAHTKQKPTTEHQHNNITPNSNMSFPSTFNTGPNATREEHHLYVKQHARRGQSYIEPGTNPGFAVLQTNKLEPEDNGHTIIHFWDVADEYSISFKPLGNLYLPYNQSPTRTQIFRWPESENKYWEWDLPVITLRYKHSNHDPTKPEGHPATLPSIEVTKNNNGTPFTVNTNNHTNTIHTYSHLLTGNQSITYTHPQNESTIIITPIEIPTHPTTPPRDNQTTYDQPMDPCQLNFSF